jgi:DNA end-binding protein Ku
MAARAVASATISFGLVSIPVKLFSTAVSSSGIHFNLLHKACGGRVKQQYVCPKDDNVVVPRDEMVKGYEFAKDQFVTFSDEELKTLEEKSTQSVDITEFVPLDKVPPTYFEKSYYLAPDKGGERAYHLLCEAMKKTGKSAVAKYAARGKQYLVVVFPHEEGLLLQQLYYSDEVRPSSEVPVGESDVKESELNLALQLIAQISKDSFRPEQYEDDVKKRVEAAIEQKVSGKEVTVAGPEPKAQIIDLMAALKASLSGGAPASAPQSTDTATPGAEADDAADRKGPKRAVKAGEKKKSKAGE